MRIGRIEFMTTAIEKVDKSEKALEFTPFGSEQKIKLSIAIVKNVCAVKTKSGRTCSDADAMKFMMLCQGKGLNPFEGDAYLVGYDSTQGGTIIPTFSQITAHQALLKRAEVHAEYKGMDSGIVVKGENGEQQERKSCFILEDEELLGGWALIHRVTKMPVYSKLALSQRKPGYETQFWKGSKAAEQIQKCAEADALRMAFPSKIGGLFLRDEMDFPINIDARAIDLPQHRLVDVTPVAELQAPEEQEPPSEKPKPEPAPANSARADLAQFIVGEGFTFDHFKQWGLESGNVPNADSIGSFDEVPEVDAKRILRSKEGLKKGLALAKGKP
jgi:phage recombination protein Bet